MKSLKSGILPVLHKMTTIGRNAMKRRNFSVMARKVGARLKEGGPSSAIRAWYDSKAEPYQDYLKALDFGLWEETQRVCGALTKAAEDKLKTVPFDLGGGGNYELLYFLTRTLGPAAVVETGVAAGWSSQAILSALKTNGAGHLYSSDFPYFRIKDPERYIGFVVEEALKKRWSLFIEGDQYNLPKILHEAPRIDLFHYDSDKSCEGRQKALALVSPRLSDKAAVIFDDIQDNAHFKNMVEASGRPFKVFGFGGKYLGLTGPFLEETNPE